MKILLDESTPQKLRLLIDSRHLTGRQIAILVLSTNNWAVVRQEIESIHAAIEAARPGSFTFVEIGHARGSGC